MKVPYITRIALTTVSILCLGVSAMAGPTPRFMMVDGQMMEVIPMTSDVTLKNGCKVCMNGAIITRSGKTIKLTDGDMVSAAGKRISPPSLHAHGG